MSNKIVFALAVPTTADWRPERADSLERLKSELGFRPPIYREFREKVPNWVWSRFMWRWAADQHATHFLQLQDDIRPMPQFWPVLRAMIESNPDQVIGLQTNHPVARSLAHNGRRWMRTRAWLVGCQYVIPLQGPNSIKRFLEWLEASEDQLTTHQREHEDVLLSTWVASTGRDVWHPIPAIADVDLSIGSTYEGTPGHIDDHRRPVVTWQGYDAAAMSDPLWWQVPAHVELYRGAGPGPCVSCNEEEGWVNMGQFVTIGRRCWLNMQAKLAGFDLRM